MKVLIWDRDNEVTVNVPTWNYELFMADPETYLEPICEDMDDACWSILSD